MTDDDFAGHSRRDCGEHRSTGTRAWCFDCTEWCYPHAPCVRCEVPQLRARLDRIADAHYKWVGPGGLTSGYCAECDLAHPCPTHVWASTDRDPLSTWDPEYDNENEDTT